MEATWALTPTTASTSNILTDAFVDSAGRRGDDAWDMSHGSWRLDWQADDKNTLTLQIDEGCPG
jgi:hypothetical protein